jgi:hypothetical protein
MDERLADVAIELVSAAPGECSGRIIDLASELIEAESGQAHE